MRRWRIASLAVLLAGMVAAYAASPLVAAWGLRQALHARDAAGVESRVAWDHLRASLRGAGSELESFVTEMTAEPEPASQGLWARLKAAAAPLVLGSALDRAVTPQGLIQLYALRETWRQRVRPTLRLVEPETVLHGTRLEGTGVDQALSALHRLERAAFVSPSAFELEVRDRYNAARRFRARFERTGFAWKLAGIAILRDAAPPPAGAPGAES